MSRAEPHQSRCCSCPARSRASSCATRARTCCARRASWPSTRPRVPYGRDGAPAAIRSRAPSAPRPGARAAPSRAPGGGADLPPLPVAVRAGGAGALARLRAVVRAVRPHAGGARRGRAHARAPAGAATPRPRARAASRVRGLAHGSSSWSARPGARRCSCPRPPTPSRRSDPRRGGGRRLPGQPRRARPTGRLLRALAERMPELTLLMIGDVDERALPRRRRLRGLPASCRASCGWAGASDEEAARLMACADAGIAPFRRDDFNEAGLPNRILKAARLGLRTVTPDFPGARRLVEGRRPLPRRSTPGSRRCEPSAAPAPPPTPGCATGPCARPPSARTRRCGSACASSACGPRSGRSPSLGLERLIPS